MVAKSQDTRERILGNALDLASTVGFEGLSIGKLAKATKMSKSGLFAHFESKEDLQLEVLRTAAAHFIDAVVSPSLLQPRGEPRVRALFNRWIEWDANRRGGCPFVAASHELDDRSGRLRDALVSVQKDWVGTLAKAVRIAIEEKHFRDDLDADQMAFEIYGVAMAFHLFHRLMRDPSAHERAKSAFEQLLSSAK